MRPHAFGSHYTILPHAHTSRTGTTAPRLAYDEQESTPDMVNNVYVKECLGLRGRGRMCAALCVGGQIAVPQAAWGRGNVRQ
ncbi:hypothetical protein FACS189415_1390 [Bacteroidia bacterium]|nr:hypothetical protein FACS189415_1390 [Bacteroidia bacterium]